jgi:hypothetical protein
MEFETLPEVEFMALYDVSSGQVISVGPSHAFVNDTNKVSIDKETAELIIEGKINLTSCFVDMQNGTIEIAEIKTMFKIDDVLHRIISTEYTDVIPDVLLTFEKSTNSITFSLSDQFNGKRKVLWDGETVMNFLITDYNDPNILYNMLSLKVSDLVGNSVIVDNLEVPKKFSVYTRRLFKNYVIEYK